MDYNLLAVSRLLIFTRLWFVSSGSISGLKFISNWSQYKCRSINPQCEVQFQGLLVFIFRFQKHQTTENQLIKIKTQFNYCTSPLLFRHFPAPFFTFSSKKNAKKILTSLVTGKNAKVFKACPAFLPLCPAAVRGKFQCLNWATTALRRGNKPAKSWRREKTGQAM